MMPLQMELENLLFSYLVVLKLDSNLRSDSGSDDDTFDAVADF
jgi:hypothetical protein